LLAVTRVTKPPAIIGYEVEAVSNIARAPILVFFAKAWNLRISELRAQSHPDLRWSPLQLLIVVLCPRSLHLFSRQVPSRHRKTGACSATNLTVSGTFIARKPASLPLDAIFYAPAIQSRKESFLISIG
jgi:hypothetical protein